MKVCKIGNSTVKNGKNGRTSSLSERNKQLPSFHKKLGSKLSIFIFTSSFIKPMHINIFLSESVISDQLLKDFEISFTSPFLLPNYSRLTNIYLDLIC